MGTHDHHHEQRVPRAALLGAGALILATLALSAQARSGGREEALVQAPAVEQRELRFEDRPNGSVGVLDASTGREVDVVPPAEGGFVRGVMRGMFRTRKLESIPHDHPFRLMRLADGSLVIEDPDSGRRVDLRAFGSTNYEAFARLLSRRGSVP